MICLMIFKGGSIDSDLVDMAKDALLSTCERIVRRSDPHLADDIEWLLDVGAGRTSEDSNTLENILLRIRRGGHVRKQPLESHERPPHSLASGVAGEFRKPKSAKAKRRAR